MNRLQRRVFALTALVGLGVLAAAGSPSMAASKRPAENIRGQTINVLVPYRIPPRGDLVVHEGDGGQGQLRRDRLGCHAHEARRRQHGAHVHRRRCGVRLVVHGPVRGRQVGRAARELSAQAAPGRSREHGRRLQVGRQDVRGLLQQRLPHLDLQQEDVRQGGHHDVPAHARRSGQGCGQAQGRRHPVPALDPDGCDRGRRHPVVPAHARERRKPLRQELQAHVPEARLGGLPGPAVGGAGRQEGLGLARRRVARRRHRVRQVHRGPDRDRARDRPGQPRDRQRQVAIEHRRAGRGGARPRA